MSLISQRHIKGLRFDTVAEAELSGRVIEACYIFETRTFYEYKQSSSLPIDHTSILSTGQGGGSRWVAVAGRYELGKFARPITDVAVNTVFIKNELPELQFDLGGNVMMELVNYGDI